VTRLVNIWSGPRNVSTALMYAFREHPDTTVVDEPLYAAYLDRFPEIEHPGRDEVLRSQPTDPRVVIDRLLSDDWPTDVVVAKQMASHLRGLGTDWLDDCTNALLVRAPEPVVASYAKQVEAPTLDQLGYPVQADLVEVALARGERPVVLETGRLLADPEGVLRRCCALLGMDFTEEMLTWDAGPVPEDGVWAPYWYARTHESTGFDPPTSRRVELPDHLAEVAAAARPLYDRIAAHAL
jgi:hypothetical protein